MSDANELAEKLEASAAAREHYARLARAHGDHETADVTEENARAERLAASTLRANAERIKALEEALDALALEVGHEIAAEHRALDEWRETGGPNWKDDHPAIARLKRLSALVTAARAARSNAHD